MALNKKVFKYIRHPSKILLFLGSRGRLKFIPDYLFLKIIFRSRLNKKLNLKSPETFNEKLQWLKLYDRKPEYTLMVDKYDVRKYIADNIGEKYLVPLLGVWEKFDEIDFESLPNQFVLKCTHDSGGLIICKDKSTLDIENARKKINRCLKRNYYYGGREWPYKNIKPRIIAEKLIVEDIIDYKFYCFNGEPYYLYVSQGLDNHKTARISFYDMNLNKAPFGRSDYLPFLDEVKKPNNFELMVDVAKYLSKNLPFIRVDLYSVGENVYFSELTFSPCSGFMPFDPPEYDKVLGNLVKLPFKSQN